MLRHIDYKYFDKAKQIASVSDVRQTHIGCVAVHQGQVVGLGCNCNKTHPIQKKYDKYRELNIEGCRGISRLHSLHAEMNCLNQLKNLDVNFAKVKLYIYRIRKDQPYGLARPCPACMAAIKDFGIKDIFYTTNDGFSHEHLENMNIGGVA